MTHHAYLFEAKSIQRYILDSGKLRDLVGASELIDSLCAEKGLLDDTLRELEIHSVVEFSRRAGGAFYAFSEEEAALDRLATLWPLVVQQYAPGLEFDIGRGQGESDRTAFDAAMDDLHQDRSRPRVDLPQPGPRVQRSRRTGRAASGSRKLPDGGFELLDRQTKRQRRFNNSEVSGLSDKFVPASMTFDGDVWPIDLSPADAVVAVDPEQLEEEREAGSRLFPFKGDSRYIAVVHADGNGLGLLLNTLHEGVHPERFISAFRTLSEEIDRATRAAAKAAVRQILVPVFMDEEKGVMPARPIVLGGDDLTLIVRADLALPFTQCFLRAFEAESRTAMAKVIEAAGFSEGLPDRLTACAGLAYIKASQPFALAAGLAEGITKGVKRLAKRWAEKTDDALTPPSSLGFHRVTTAMIDDYPAVLARELSTGGEGADAYRHTLGAYGVGDPLPEQNDIHLPPLDALLGLQTALEREEMARGPAREVLSLIDQSPHQAQTRFQRWHGLLHESGRISKSTVAALDDALGRLVPGWEPQKHALPYRGTTPMERAILGAAGRAGPLGDLHALMAVKNALPGPDSSAQRGGNPEAS